MVVAQMDEAGNRVNIVVLDACRDNPFARSFRSTSRGLAQMDSAKGSFLAYATSPGSTAADGNGRNGIYTKHLLESLAEPDSRLEEVFKRVRLGVARETDNKQIPWDASSVLGDFYFRGPGVNSPAQISEPRNPELEINAWSAIQNSNRREDLQDFLQKYPKSQFLPKARNRLLTLANPLIQASPISPSNKALANKYFSEGTQYRDGQIGFAKSLVEAGRLFRAAAELGFGPAQAELGLMYLNGIGGFPKDPLVARNYFEAAAIQGDSVGQANLGIFYAAPLAGVTKDEQQALELFRLSAQQHNPLGQVQLGLYLESGNSAIRKDEDEALNLFERAAKQGNALAQAKLGEFYQFGRGGLQRSDTTAVRYYRMAAESGDSLGQAHLGSMYQGGLGGLRYNETEAARLFRLSAEQGNPNGLTNLARMFEEGRGGLQQSKEVAIRLYQTAARNGYVYAQSQLARLGASW
jgi:TPR repeat protein